MKKYFPILLFVICLGGIILGSFFSIDFIYLLYFCPLIILFFCVGSQGIDNEWNLRDKKPKGRKPTLTFSYPLNDNPLNLYKKNKRYDYEYYSNYGWVRVDKNSFR
tara:strand:- start:665 stop:982 length:318 start_codon:yes stop_codon:yes gene_type:complete